MSETTIIPFTLSDERQRYVYLAEGSGAGGPQKAHADDAAYDLRAAEDVCLGPGDHALVKTGVRLAIPEGFAGLVLPRSGLANKHLLTIPNAPGLIDPGYRGEVLVGLYRLPTFREIADIAVGGVPGSYEVHRGDRIAQLLIVRTADVSLQYSDPLCFQTGQVTMRGEGGFGSTGR